MLKENQKAKIKMQNDRAKVKNHFLKPFYILNCNFNFLSLIFDIC